MPVIKNENIRIFSKHHFSKMVDNSLPECKNFQEFCLNLKQKNDQTLDKQWLLTT